MPEQKQAQITGAGIAGMSAAIALADKGMRVVLHEKSCTLAEVGAGLQLAPNATSLLRAWGVLDGLYEDAVEPERIILKNGKNGRTLVDMNIRAISRRRWQAPYLTIHRADLQKALKAAIDRNPLIDFRPGHEIVSLHSLPDIDTAPDRDTGCKTGKTAASRTSGETYSPIRIICDGVRSRLRADLSEKARFSGYIAWRATLEAAQIPPAFLAATGGKTVSAWMGENGHFVAYPLKNGQTCNFVAITRSQNPGSDGAEKENAPFLSDLFNGWHHAITDVIRQAGQWTFWPLFTMPFPRFLGPTGEVFLGDASHAVTPFAAQGAAMAIEDGAALATALTAPGLTRTEALSLFSRERCKRLKAVAQRGDFNRLVYHASGPFGFARDLVMRLRPDKKFLTDLDWLYGYDATAFLTADTGI